MASDQSPLRGDNILPYRPWHPPVTWIYNTFIMEYDKGGRFREEGWNEEHGEMLNQLGRMGWEAVNLTHLNDTQFAILMKYPVPQNIDDKDQAEAIQYVNDMLEKAWPLFGL